MTIFYDDRCAGYATPGHPERPVRVIQTAARIREARPDWSWSAAPAATKGDALLIHSEAHWDRLAEERDFDPDTAYHPAIREHAARSAGAACAAMEVARSGGGPAFSLMRPPGHHACRDRAMGFCYLSNIALAAVKARAAGVPRVAIWDFDAHHGNGTEDVVLGADGILFASVHQWPGYPGTGSQSRKNCLNFPVAPMAPRESHRRALQNSWDHILAFEPDLLLVSAGFDAYARDPITDMTLVADDFSWCGELLYSRQIPAAAILEGGYSNHLPELVLAFLQSWEGKGGRKK
jgi:acetoin utilization deacetylase AcuC-like enzyme